jgi:hypothetical protein
MSAAGCPFCARRRQVPALYRHAWTLLRIAALVLLVWYVAHRFGQMGE